MKQPRQPVTSTTRHDPVAFLSGGAGNLFDWTKHMTPFQTGYLATCHAIANGTLETKLNDISHNEGSVSDTYGGAISCVLSVYRDLLKAGITVESDDKQIDAFLKADPATQIIQIRRFLSAGDGKALSALAGVVHSCRMFVTFREKQIAPTGPTQVQVVAMPERVTSTEVERDAQGNIAAARQVERDAVTPPAGATSLQH